MGGSQQGRVLHIINEILNMAAHQSIQGPVFTCYNLEQINEALAHVEENRATAVVITFNKWKSEFAVQMDSNPTRRTIANDQYS